MVATGAGRAVLPAEPAWSAVRETRADSLGPLHWGRLGEGAVTCELWGPQNCLQKVGTHEVPVQQSVPQLPTLLAVRAAQGLSTGHSPIRLEDLPVSFSILATVSDRFTLLGC